ncbi:MAG TPA: glutathione S-transferase family protein [Xanthobacteraceae bacterium]|nr:glutathione S-transferase family protein [Xanthobacteraceae bacterium]
MSGFVVHGVPGSPYVRAVLLGLAEKNCPYRFATMGPGDIHSSRHLERHPFGRVPVLDHGEFRLYETQAILRYLDTVLPGPALQPRDPQLAARMNQIAGIVDCYVFKQVTIDIAAERMFAQLFWNRPTDESIIAAAVPKARICIRELDRLKGDAPFMAGDAVSIADLMLAPHLAYFAMTPEGAMLKETSLLAWLDRMAARESWRATERDNLLQAA